MTKILEEAIKSYNNWQEPWGFADHVRNEANLSEADKAEFELIWQTANTYEDWSHLPTQTAPDNITRKLADEFHIDLDIAYKIINAASYDWK